MAAVVYLTDTMDENVKQLLSKFPELEITKAGKVKEICFGGIWA